MIQAAAIKAPDGTVYSVPQPGRHHNVIALMVEHGLPIPIKGVQGFITTEGRFVDREEALPIARENGQLKAYKHNPVSLLYSEDMW